MTILKLDCCLLYSSWTLLLSNSHSQPALQIKIDDQDIREVTLESLRKSIGVVPQDTVS
jgi:ABC-type multidrug transport system fused ATPase/permease subunit